jgi:hypothetical protein
LHKYSQLIFDEEAKAVQWSQDSFFRILELNIFAYKKNKADTDLMPFTK